MSDITEKPAPTITMINFAQSLAALEDGRIVPITDWLDSDGDDCDPQDATQCVCGSDETGWFHVDLTEYYTPEVH